VTGRVLAAACVLALGATGAGAARPPVSLVASPAHVSLNGRATQSIQVANSGAEPLVVDVGRAGFALDLSGRTRVVPRRPAADVAAWLTVRPGRLVIRPGGTASLTVSSSPPRRAEPGDHGALVLLTTRPRSGLGLAVRMRIGVVVVVRVPGRIVHRVDLIGLRVKRAGRTRLLELWLANRGNVTETLRRSCVRVSLRRNGRVLARLRTPARDLLPRTRGIAELRYRGPVRGWVAARAELSVRTRCAHPVRRVFRIRL
jgi:hypothetical protein